METRLPVHALSCFKLRVKWFPVKPVVVQLHRGPSGEVVGGGGGWGVVVKGATST